MTPSREKEIRDTLASIPPAERDPHDVAIAELLEVIDDLMVYITSPHGTYLRFLKRGATSKYGMDK